MLSDGTRRWIYDQMTLGSDGSYKYEKAVYVKEQEFYQLDKNGNVLYEVETGTYSIGDHVLHITATDQNGKTRTFDILAHRLSNRFIYKYNVGNGVDFNRAQCPKPRHSEEGVRPTWESVLKMFRISGNNTKTDFF